MSAAATVLIPIAVGALAGVLMERLSEYLLRDAAAAPSLTF